MMRCETFINSIDDFLGAELPQSRRRKMEEHLKSCASCREELRSLQSLMDSSASLPRTVMPDRDLWPQIAAGITAAGSPASESGNGSWLPRVSRWIWRLAPVAVLGAMLVFAATYLRNHSPAVAPKTSVEPNGPVGAGQSPQTPSVPGAQGPTQEPQPEQAETNPPQDGKAPPDYTQACQCDASPEILSLIDKAWIVDNNVPVRRTRALIAERLYNLAAENGDSFFLHKASLDARTHSMLLSMPSGVSERYRLKLAQHPDDPALTYLFAYTLLGKDTLRMAQLMQQLVADHPEFPWPVLALAQIEIDASRPDQKKLQSYIQAFMKLCPKSAEPIRPLAALGNSDFLVDAARRMRANLAGRSDIQSLLWYGDLWALEVLWGATGQELTKVQQAISDDLKRLRSIVPDPQGDLGGIIRGGYKIIGDMETYRDLLKKDFSSNGRVNAINLEIEDWNAQNPVPPNDASAEKRTAYWEIRLRMCDSWVNEMPENSSLWFLKLEALAALKNHPDSEFLEAAATALALERESAATDQPSGSNIVKLSLLCAEKGVWLDRVPALINEGLAVTEKSTSERSTDFGRDPQWRLLLLRVKDWLQADDAWHSLAEAYLRQGVPEKAREALDYIEPELKDFKSQLNQMPPGAGADDNLIAGFRKRISDQLAAREKRLAGARAGIPQAGNK